MADTELHALAERLDAMIRTAYMPEETRRKMLALMPPLRAALEGDTKGAQTWRPISEAPKDGTRMLFWNGDAVAAGFWCDDENEAVAEPRWCADGCYGNGPTHWQPLPAPPRADVGEVEAG
jgi:hypothetical protein